MVVRFGPVCLGWRPETKEDLARELRSLVALWNRRGSTLRVRVEPEQVVVQGLEGLDSDMRAKVVEDLDTIYARTMVGAFP